MAIIYLTRFPERPAPPSTTFRSRVRPEQVLRPAESGAGWGWVRLLPEVFFPLPREKRAGNPTSALSCTTWGFSCGSAYANARWALTPPFHPYPAPSSITPAPSSTTFSRAEDLLGSYARPESGAGWCWVRVKRRGKSPPGIRVSGAARKTPCGARQSRGRVACPLFPRMREETLG